jgi:hypothetical protein
MSQELKLPKSLDNVPLPSELPPLVLIAFTRPDLLQPVLEGIARQSLLPPKIIAFVDGARKPSDEPLRESCIRLLENFGARVPVEIILRDQNLGCDPNVITALTEVLRQYWALVYLEDDTIPNPCFFDRMCRLLAAYQHHPHIFSLSAHANVPQEIMGKVETDFMLSSRVFPWGFGIWADRWHQAALDRQPPAFNPFGKFYQIPLTTQTKHTLINQFWLERNYGSDWVITLSLAALHLGCLHITPMESFTHNIGCGHTEAKTYKGGEAWWVNTSFNSDYYPDQLPESTELLPVLQTPFNGIELVEFLGKYKEMWVSPTALQFFWSKYPKIEERWAILKLFIARSPLLFQRWRGGLAID